MHLSHSKAGTFISPLESFRGDRVLVFEAEKLERDSFLSSVQGVYKPISDNGNGDKSDGNNDSEKADGFLSSSFLLFTSERKMKKVERKWTMQKMG